MSINDINSIVKIINDLDVSKYLAVVPYPYTRKDAETWLIDCKKKNSQKPRKNYVFVIADRSNDAVIGAIDLVHITKTLMMGEITYSLGKKYWNKGIMSEAIRAILDLAFNKLKLNRIQANVFVDNISSLKLLEKFGFKKEGLNVQAGYSKAMNKVYDKYTYALLRKDYLLMK